MAKEDSLQKLVKEVAEKIDEVMGLIESAIMIGDLRDAYRAPIHSKLNICVRALDTLQVQVGMAVDTPLPSDALNLPTSALIAEAGITVAVQTDIMVHNITGYAGN